MTTLDSMFGRGSSRTLAVHVDVDDVFSYPTLDDCIGIGVRVGKVTRKKSIPVDEVRQAGQYLVDMLISVLRTLADEARGQEFDDWVPVAGIPAEVVATIEHMNRVVASAFGLTAGQLGIAGAPIAAPSPNRFVDDPTLPENSFEIRSGEQVVRITNVGDGAEFVSRFVAVAAELEDL